LAKLGVLVLIAVNTRQANRSAWNDRAIDYRYLAECLRTMFYLPRVMSLHLRSASSIQYASRMLRQSAVDWLAQALVRQTMPPIDRTTDGLSILRADPSALQIIEGNWLQVQVDYHHRNALKHRRLHEWAERWSKFLNLAVIVVVVADLVITSAELWRRGRPWLLAAEALSPWMLLLAAVIPAAVASLNGLRFQSECLRLADRSEVAAALLLSRQKEARALAERRRVAETGGADPGAWTWETLALAESCARITINEVADWSVLYSKNVVEP
jgi:hypothetical protein